MWSLQYIFMRLAVPVFGTAAVAEARALFAALFLRAVGDVGRAPAHRPARALADHLAVALVNNVLPFVCFAWAATELPAGYLAIINGMVPLWTALIAGAGAEGAARRAAHRRLRARRRRRRADRQPRAGRARPGKPSLAAVVGIAGAAFWGWAGVMIKQRSGRVPPMGLAAGSIVFSAVLMAPLLGRGAAARRPGRRRPPLALIALGAVCSGIAYLPFFTLMRDIGPSRTLTVGLAVPVLGVLWGWLLLGEAVTLAMLAGTALVLAALALVLRR